MNVRPTKPEIQFEEPRNPGEKYSFKLVSGSDPDDDDVKYDWDLGNLALEESEVFDIELQSEKSLEQSSEVTAPWELGGYEWIIQARLIDPYGGKGDYSDFNGAGF